MNVSDNLAALIYLKNKVHKWKNIALILAIFSILLGIRFIFGGDLSEDFVDGNYIANIKIEGVIFEDDFRSQVLKKIAEEKSVKAVLINIDSPGGGIVGSEILFNNLREIALLKPTVVLMGSLAASGGYMASIASDHIIAHNGTLTGSIGVLMESHEITELANKIGVKFRTYKSSPLKGSPSPFEKSNPLVENVIKESIDDSHKFFSDLVTQRRGEKINPKLLNAVFDGRVFTGRQALKAGLIDELGGTKEALAYLSSQKIDVKKLPLKEVKISKQEDKILDKIFGILPFLNNSMDGKYDNQIMTIMR